MDRNSILSLAGKAKIVDVVIDDTTIKIRELTGTEKEEYEALISSYDPLKPQSFLRARLLRYAIIGEDGKNLFKREDEPQLSNLPGHIVETLWKRIKEISGLTKEGYGDIKSESKEEPSS